MLALYQPVMKYDTVINFYTTRADIGIIPKDRPPAYDVHVRDGYGCLLEMSRMHPSWGRLLYSLCLFGSHPLSVDQAITGN